MMTVKEVSQLTGISVRTLHYYDQIGLLKPSGKSPSGYRLYNNQTLERLQQILFFREFDMPLKEIKEILNNLNLDRKEILQVQREMLIAKGERINRLIANIDDLLSGGCSIDFTVFSKSAIEEICQSTIDRMPDFLRECIIKDFGGIEQWKAHYLERAGKEDMQKGYLRLVQCYGGDKKRALQAMTNPPDPKQGEVLKEQEDHLLKKLSEIKDMPVECSAVQEIIRAYGNLMKKNLGMKHIDGLMRSIAASFEDERISAPFDQQYGCGRAQYFVQAIMYCYKED